MRKKINRDSTAQESAKTRKTKKNKPEPERKPDRTRDTAPSKRRKGELSSEKQFTEKKSAGKNASKKNTASDRTAKKARDMLEAQAPQPRISHSPVTDVPSENSRRKSAAQTTTAAKSPVKIIPLGGVDGIGMNITAFEYESDILLVDCGISFPREDMPGVDVVTPDFTYLQRNEHKLRGLVLTHGHEDHIGAVPYLLKKVKCDVYGTRLTLGILDGKLSEHNIRTEDLYEVRAGEVITLGAFDVEFIHVNHSMPDAVALCITTPHGRIIHTGDFKIDFTPIGTTPIDLGRFAELGKQGVRLLLCDSTNAERAGYTPSESTLTASFDRIFNDDARRVVIATFSSNVHRVQQILEACARCQRKVALTGRSLQNVLRAAQELGYITIPEGLVIDLADCKYYPPEKLAIITTGSQGEPMSALYRMAFGAHPMVSLGPTDLVVLSASCIPGNEKLVTTIINELYKRNVAVITDRTDDVHVSGHACREELKLMHSLVHAECFVPLHGEYKHLVAHANLAKELGTKDKNVLLPEAGRIIEMDRNGIHTAGTVEAGQVMIDSGGGDGVESAVLRDRTNLSESGVVFITAGIDSEGELAFGPEIVTRGFVYVKESEELLRYLTDMAHKFLQKSLDRRLTDPTALGARLKDDMFNIIYQKTRRRPVVVTLITEVER